MKALEDSVRLMFDYSICPGCEYCDSCGDCVFCDYPHRCCCGQCGWACAHDHSPRDTVCHAESVINHSSEFVVRNDDDC